MIIDTGVHPFILEHSARARSVVYNDAGYRALALVACPGGDCAVRRNLPARRRRPSVYFVCRLPDIFPPELWLQVALYLAHPDLLRLRVVNRALSELLTPQTHKCLVLRFPDRGYSSLDRPDIRRFVGHMEVAICAFVQRHNLNNRVTKIVLDCWPCFENPLFFRSGFSAVEHVVYRGSSHRVLTISPMHILPSSVTLLELRDVSMENHSLHHLLGPSPSLKTLRIFALTGGGINAVTRPAQPDHLELASWLEANGLQHCGHSHMEAVAWFQQPKPTLDNLTLEFNSPDVEFGAPTRTLLDVLRGTVYNGTIPLSTLLPARLTFPHRLSMVAVTNLTLVFFASDVPYMFCVLQECQDTLVFFSLTINDDTALVGHPDNYFPVLPALDTLVLNCQSEVLDVMIFVLSDMCFLQAVSVELFVHPRDDPATVSRIDGWHAPLRYLEGLPDIPQMWLPTQFNRYTPFSGTIAVKRPCVLTRCTACPDVLQNLVDWMNDRYPPLPGVSNVFQAHFSSV
ncbi:hypothetical protein BDZ89DRAFT_1138716 [Hymenopellis radicata]|nr:hypothetical protein BDZ89DRAFT_1138716 [Hymenopellis radicata]